MQKRKSCADDVPDHKVPVLVVRLVLAMCPTLPSGPARHIGPRTELPLYPQAEIVSGFQMSLSSARCRAGAVRVTGFVERLPAWA
jgi:hypothetical protein